MDCGKRAVNIRLKFLLVTGRNEVLAKVIFSQASVCPQGGSFFGGGGGSSKFLGGGGVPPNFWRGVLQIFGGVFFGGFLQIFGGVSSKFSGRSFWGVPPNFLGGGLFGGVPPNFLGGGSFLGGFSPRIWSTFGQYCKVYPSSCMRRIQ